MNEIKSLDFNLKNKLETNFCLVKLKMFHQFRICSPKELIEMHQNHFYNNKSETISNEIECLKFLFTIADINQFNITKVVAKEEILSFFLCHGLILPYQGFNELDRYYFKFKMIEKYEEEKFLNLILSCNSSSFSFIKDHFFDGPNQVNLSFSLIKLQRENDNEKLCFEILRFFGLLEEQGRKNISVYVLIFILQVMKGKYFSNQIDVNIIFQLLFNHVIVGDADDHLSYFKLLIEVMIFNRSKLFDPYLSNLSKEAVEKMLSVRFDFYVEDMKTLLLSTLYKDPADLSSLKWLFQSTKYSSNKNFVNYSLFFHCSSEVVSPQIVSDLLLKGADPNFKIFDSSPFQQLFNNINDQQKLEYQVRTPCLENVQLFISHGVDSSVLDRDVLSHSLTNIVRYEDFLLFIPFFKNREEDLKDLCLYHSCQKDLSPQFIDYWLDKSPNLFFVDFRVIELYLFAQAEFNPRYSSILLTHKSDLLLNDLENSDYSNELKQFDLANFLNHNASLWTPTLHSLFPKLFKEKVLNFLILNNLIPNRLKIPKPIIKKIITHLEAIIQYL